ncbi:MAG: site-2 protease family protein [Dehalococcoidia bacterium]|nr:site-2 protease family protein [Dehalococcoidia bacterium]
MKRLINPQTIFRMVGSAQGSVLLGRIFGIPIRLHFTWFIIFALVTLSLSFNYFPLMYPGWGRPLQLITGVITGLLFFSSIIAHELSHSVVSKALGVPVKNITLFIFGGVAQISREAPRPMGELKMAVAGPLSSVAIGVIFGAIWRFAGPYSQPVEAVTYWLMLVNFALAVFNLIPGFPLDGGRVLRSVLWQATGDYRKATRVATRIGQGVAYAFVFGGLLIIFTGNIINGVWFALIGWFLENAASHSYRQVLFREGLGNITVSRVMTPECLVVSPDLTIRQLVEGFIFPTGARCFMATRDNRLEGIITMKDIKSVPREQWDLATVETAMTPNPKLKIARPGDDALTVLELMDEADINQMPVVEENRIAGVVTRANLIRLIHARSDLRV